MGYNKLFIDNQIIYLPEIESNYLADNILLDYTHFSILYSKKRKQPICTAVNIDGKSYLPFNRGNDIWKHDQKVIGFQIAEQFYPKTNQEFHKGHIVRRLDPCWGDEATSKKAEEDTFHYTNASPQHRKFNPKIWLELEKNLLEKGAVSLDQKISVFSGPVLNPIDKPYNNPLVEEEILIPSHFWKIVIWKKTNGKIYAVGFMQSQKEYIDKLVDQNFEKAVFRDHDDYYENIKFKGE
jgi:endonuclease G